MSRIIIFTIFSLICTGISAAKVYNTEAMCTTVHGIEYCIMEEFPYIINIGEKEISIKTPNGTMTYLRFGETHNISDKDGKEYTVIATIDEDNDFALMVDDGYSAWFSDKYECFVMKFWPKNNASFKKTHKFVELTEYEDFYGMVNQCALNYTITTANAR